jgi:molybdopterin/thiamine biosynthesis adenylyltransferase
MALTDDQLERYARHIILKEVGGAGQAKLLKARVLVIGAGGLGAPMLMYLAAAGVGTIGIVDDDVVSLSNLQRQIIHKTTLVGAKKVESAKEMLAAINPDINVITHDARLTPENAAALIRQYDIVADGSDNFETRFLINDVCYRERKTLVSAALSQFEGQLTTYRAFEGGHFPCYRCLFPGPPGEGASRSCAEAGILGALAGVMGSLQALEVIKEILGLGESLAGYLLIYDALDARFRKVKFAKDPHCALCGTGQP